jgi:glycosyltransferase involved in cell wall biosynthesis
VDINRKEVDCNQSKTLSPKISIITVCLNAQEFIEQCIQSVLAQGFKDFEYVIIDGGSTDGTVEIIEKYHDKITYWHSKQDRGLAHAFNLGVEHSSGQWLLFLNSDDYFDSSNVLRDMADHIEKHSTADVVFGQVVVMTREQVPRKIGGPYGDVFQWDEFCLKDTIPHQAAFSSRDFFERIGPFSEKFRIAVDYEHFLRGGPKLKVEFVPVMVANMRDGGLSRRDVLASLREWSSAQVVSGGRSKLFAQLTYAYYAVRMLIGVAWRKLL